MDQKINKAKLNVVETEELKREVELDIAIASTVTGSPDMIQLLKENSLNGKDT